VIPISYFLGLAAALFAVGAFGVLWRRNALIVLMGVELMLNAANLTLLAFARARNDMRGHAIAFLVIATAAAEAAVGLAIVVGIFRTRQTANIDEMTLMKH
jgi:NADH-quinone oxidoreductase subunit K